MLDTESQESYAEWSWPLADRRLVGHFGVLRAARASLGAVVDLAGSPPALDPATR